MRIRSVAVLAVLPAILVTCLVAFAHDRRTEARSRAILERALESAGAGPTCAALARSFVDSFAARALLAPMPCTELASAIPEESRCGSVPFGFWDVHAMADEIAVDLERRGCDILDVGPGRETLLVSRGRLTSFTYFFGSLRVDVWIEGLVSQVYPSSEDQRRVAVTVRETGHRFPLNFPALQTLPD